VVRKRNRLGLLQVGVRRNHGVPGPFGSIHHNGHQVPNLLDPVVDGTAEVETKIKGDLVVSRPSRVQVPGLRSDQLTEPAFNGGVDVLVGGLELKPAGVGFFEDVFEAFFDPLDDVVRQEVDFAEHADMSKRPRDVVNQQPSI
jgi:hypothetical protein